MIQNLIFRAPFFENIISGIQLYEKIITRSFIIFKKPRKMTIRPHVSVGIIRFFFNFRFSRRKAQSQQKLAEKITHFTIQFCSKNLTHFIKLNSLDIWKYMFRQDSQKPFSLYKFSSKHVSGWCTKKHLHYTISRRPRTAFSKHLKANVCVFL